MRRRAVLASVGAASGGLAGCSGLLGDDVSCEAGEEETSLREALEFVDRSGRASPDVDVRGTVAAFPRRGMIITDGTGFARLTAGVGFEFDADELSPGDCVKTEGGLDKRASWDNQMPIISIDRREFERVGETDDPDIATVEDVEPPSGGFRVDFGSGGGSVNTAVTMTYTGDTEVDPESLSVIYGDPRPDVRRPSLERTREEPATELTDADPVTPGDELRIEVREDIKGNVLWRSGTGWNRDLGGWET